MSGDMLAAPFHRVVRMAIIRMRGSVVDRGSWKTVMAVPLSLCLWVRRVRKWDLWVLKIGPPDQHQDRVGRNHVIKRGRSENTLSSLRDNTVIKRLLTYCYNLGCRV